jgi:hypothetical protein
MLLQLRIIKIHMRIYLIVGFCVTGARSEALMRWAHRRYFRYCSRISETTCGFPKSLCHQWFTVSTGFVSRRLLSAIPRSRIRSFKTLVNSDSGKFASLASWTLMSGFDRSTHGVSVSFNPLATIVEAASSCVGCACKIMALTSRSTSLLDFKSKAENHRSPSLILTIP